MATIEDVWTAPDGSKRPRYGTGRRYRVRCDDLRRCGMSEFSAGPAFSPALPAQPAPRDGSPAAYRDGIRTPTRAQSSRRRARGIAAPPVWSMSLTAFRASAAMRGTMTWSAMTRRVRISGTPSFRTKLPRSCKHASTLVSVLSAGVGLS